MADPDLNTVVISVKSVKKAKNKIRNATPSFEVFDIVCVLCSLGAFMADLSTDIILAIEYMRHGYVYWAVSTLLLMFLPACIAQFFSFRWHQVDEELTRTHYITHACLLGIVYRYVNVLRTGLDARASGKMADFQKLYQRQSDLCMLHLFDSFMESAPQLVLQLYIMITLEGWQPWTGLSAAASLCSLAWAITAYTRSMRRSTPDKQRVRWPGLVLQAMWRSGMLAARISALVLFALAFGMAWLCPTAALHWIAMTAWIIAQDTDFCATVCEERVYNCVVGVIYCFCFFNLQEGRSRKRITAFYTVIVTQNFVCLAVVISLNKIQRLEIVLAASGFIIGGTVIGLTSMILYYTLFHPAGRMPFCYKKEKLEYSSTTNVQTFQESNSHSNTLRSLKRPWSVERDEHSSQPETSSVENSPHSDDICTDKKLLLENWIARSGSPMFASAPVTVPDLDSSNDGVEFYTVQNTPVNKIDVSDGIVNNSFKSDKDDVFDSTKKSEELKQKRRGICSPTELGIKLSELSSDDNQEENDEHSLRNSNLSLQKRRGICSSAQLEIELNQMSENDGHDILDHSNIRQNEQLENETNNCDSECLNDLDEMESIAGKPAESTISKPSGIGTPSEILSTHDYENICAVNIAREPWGLRSWRGYCDIENFLHDDSTVRDRRRDTLASTITSGSSELSSHSSPLPPVPMRKPETRQDNYLDTLIYDLENCGYKRSSDASDDSEESNVFIAKPYVVDQNGAMFPLCMSLEPIVEELEESSSSIATSDICPLRRFGSASVSSLVATIDEIRRDSTNECSRNTYFCPENIWDRIDSDKTPHLVLSNEMQKLSNVDSNEKCYTIKTHPSECPLSNVVLESPKTPGKRNLKLSDEKPNIARIISNFASECPLSNIVIESPKAEVFSKGKLKSVELKTGSSSMESLLKQTDVESNIERHQLSPKSGKFINNSSKSTESLFKSDPVKVKYQVSPKSKAFFRNCSNSTESLLKSGESTESIAGKSVSKVLFDNTSNSMECLVNGESTVKHIQMSPISFEEVIFLSKLKHNDDENTKDSKTSAVPNENSIKGNALNRNKKLANRPRRKFSLLRERFEPKSKQNLEPTKKDDIIIETKEIKLINKENLTPVITKMNQWNNLTEQTPSVDSVSPVSESDKQDVASDGPDIVNLQEKRSLFLKQVLSPPKLNTLLKKGSPK